MIHFENLFIWDNTDEYNLIKQKSNTLQNLLYIWL